MAHDPRPVIRADGDRATIDALSCSHCGKGRLAGLPRCPSCSSEGSRPISVGPIGSVWSATTILIPVGLREPPFSLAYVDFEEGLRVLCHLRERSGDLPGCGTSVRLTGTTALGDPEVEVA